MVVLISLGTLAEFLLRCRGFLGGKFSCSRAIIIMALFHKFELTFYIFYEFLASIYEQQKRN